MPRSRRIKQATLEGGMPDGHSFCRRCGQIRRLDEFYPAVNLYLDAATKVMSICKSCVGDIFNDALASEGSVQGAVLKTCRLLGMRYDESAIEAAMKQAESKGTEFSFGYYKAKLMLVSRSNITDKASDLDLTYVDNPIVNMSHPINPDEVSEEVKEFWGEGYATKEYKWLESRMDRWKKTHRCETEAEETLLREIVFKQFEIETARKAKDVTGALVKELQDIIKTAALDPAKASAANSSKGNETFSAFIKMIEENEPAEYYQDKGLFKDFDKIGPKYFVPYVVRSIKNFITGSRDFNVEEGDEEDGDDVLETSGDLSKGDEDGQND